MMHDRRATWLVEIQALRGLAVLGVIVHHAYGNLLIQPHRALDWLHAHLDYWGGVDLFFAISGFVIARASLPALAACTTRRETMSVIFEFWIRRAARLWPSAWLWLAIILAASILFNTTHLFGPVQANIWATICGVFNVANIRFSQAFMRYDYGASFAWWSLSLEEQFYLLLPLAAWLTGRALPFLLVAVVAYQFPFVRGILGMSFRTDAIAMGVLLAIMEGSAAWRVAARQINPAPRWLMAVAVLALFAALGTFGTEPWTHFRFRIGFIALISVVLVFLAAQDTGRLLGEGRLRKVLVWIGARSYGLYLIHIPAMFATREAWARLGGANDYLQLVTAAALMLLLAEANWRWVEQPFRRRGTRAASRLLPQPAFSGI